MAQQSEAEAQPLCDWPPEERPMSWTMKGVLQLPTGGAGDSDSDAEDG